MLTLLIKGNQKKWSLTVTLEEFIPKIVVGREDLKKNNFSSFKPRFSITFLIKFQNDTCQRQPENNQQFDRRFISVLYLICDYIFV
jgi:hypothetical protein